MNVLEKLRYIEGCIYSKTHYDHAYKVWLESKFGLIRCLEIAAGDLAQYRSLGMTKPPHTVPGYLKLAIESDPDMEGINIVEDDNNITFYW